MGRVHEFRCLRLATLSDLGALVHLSESFPCQRQGQEVFASPISCAEHVTVPPVAASVPVTLRRPGRVRIAWIDGLGPRRTINLIAAEADTVTIRQQRSPSPAAAARWTRGIALGSGARACERSSRLRGASQPPPGRTAPVRRPRQSAVSHRVVAGSLVRDPRVVGVVVDYSVELGARGDVELGEHLAEVVGDGVLADDQPLADLDV